MHWQGSVIGAALCLLGISGASDAAFAGVVPVSESDGVVVSTVRGEVSSRPVIRGQCSGHFDRATPPIDDGAVTFAPTWTPPRPQNLGSHERTVVADVNAISGGALEAALRLVATDPAGRDPLDGVGVPAEPLAGAAAAAVAERAVRQYSSGASDGDERSSTDRERGAAAPPGARATAPHATAAGSFFSPWSLLLATVSLLAAAIALIANWRARKLERELVAARANTDAVAAAARRFRRRVYATTESRESVLGDSVTSIEQRVNGLAIDSEGELDRTLSLVEQRLEELFSLDTEFLDAACAPPVSTADVPVPTAEVDAPAADAEASARDAGIAAVAERQPNGHNHRNGNGVAPHAADNGRSVADDATASDGADDIGEYSSDGVLTAMERRVSALFTDCWQTLETESPAEPAGAEDQHPPLRTAGTADTQAG